MHPKIVVILGPTASGKSDLAVEIAKKCNGEVVSADSRQVYKDLNIGTGKISKKEMKGVPHYMLNVASPKNVFSVQDYKVQAEKAITKILKKGKVPIICGGTGFYIQAIVDGIELPEVPPNPKLRKKLEKKSVLELFSHLLELDPRRAETIDPENPVRLIRAIEVATTLGSVPAIKQNPKFEALQIGIETDLEKLKERISKRLLKRIEIGMIGEAKKLHTKGLSWERMEELGLEYRYLAHYLQNKISKEEFIEKLTIAINQYAKRQMTWFKRDQRIIWLPLSKKAKINSAVKKFLSQAS